MVQYFKRNATKTTNIFLFVDFLFVYHTADIYIFFFLRNSDCNTCDTQKMKSKDKEDGIYVIKRSIRVVRSVVRHVSLHFANPPEDGENKERQREFGEGHAATSVGSMGRINGTGSIKRHAHVRIMHMRERKTSFTTHHNRFLKRFFSISEPTRPRRFFSRTTDRTRVKIFEYLALRPISCLQRSRDLLRKKPFRLIIDLNR